MWSVLTERIVSAQVAGLGAAEFLDTVVKATVLLALASGITALMRRQSAAVRHLVWMLTLAALPALPVLSLVLPGWNVLPGWATVAAPANAPLSSWSGEDRRIIVDSSAARLDSSIASQPPTAGIGDLERDLTPRGGSQEQSVSWRGRALTVWVLGAVVSLLPWLLGTLSLRRLERDSKCVERGLLVSLTGKLAHRARVHRRVRLLVTGERDMPMHWGIARPRILIPASARQWPADRLTAVLLHELAHVRRWDCLTQLFARCVCAVYWFHPLVWWAEGRMRAEGEAACDDTALTAGCPAPDYAEHLLVIASGRHAPSVTAAAAIGMARRTCLEDRVRRILDGKRNRRSLSFAGTVACLAIVVAMLSPVAMLRVQANAVAEDPVRDEASVLSNADASPAQGPMRIGQVDDSAEGQRSIAGSGHAVVFERPRRARYLMAVEIHASRYGDPNPPAEDFHLYVLGENRELIQAVPFPYSMIERGTQRWYTLKLPAVKVPKKFYVALSFNPHRTKGIYLGIDESVKQSTSFIGRPTSGYRPVEENYDWMIRSILVQEIPTQSPFEEQE